MKRKRAVGGGRKPTAGPTSSLTFRIPNDLRRELELEATEGASVSERITWHLRQSLNRKREEERDPALKGLLLLIARLAEGISGGELVADNYVRSRMRSEWRTELFKFRAFKFAVKKLLDTLEEPPELSSLTTEEERKQAAKNVAENFGAEFSKLISEIHRSPEAMGGWVFGNIWTRFTKSDLPFSEAERRMIRKQPVLGSAMEREHRGFQKARKALELKSDRLQETLEHIRKTGKKLSPQMEEALKRISKAVGLPHIEDVMELLEQTEKLKVKNPKG